MLALHLDARGRDGPHPVRSVDLGPQRPAHVAGPHGGQHQELQRQFDEGSRVRRSRRRERRRHVPMRQRLPVRHDVVPRAERRADAVTRVVVAKLHRNSPLQHSADPVADAPGRGGVLVPDPPQGVDDVGAGHVADGHPADVREREPREARLPVVGVSRVAPARAHVVPHPLGSLGKGGHAAGVTLLGERIASGAGELAVSKGDLAGLLERDERRAAESEFAAPTADGEPLHPD